MFQKTPCHTKQESHTVLLSVFQVLFPSPPYVCGRPSVCFRWSYASITWTRNNNLSSIHALICSRFHTSNPCFQSDLVWLDCETDSTTVERVNGVFHSNQTQHYWNTTLMILLIAVTRTAFRTVGGIFWFHCRSTMLQSDAEHSNSFCCLAHENNLYTPSLIAYFGRMRFFMFGRNFHASNEMRLKRCSLQRAWSIRLSIFRYSTLFCVSRE